MKHRFLTRGACLLLCMLLLACGAAAEKMAQLQGLTVPLDTERIDFGRTKVQDYDALKGFLFSLPALRHVDMYATPISGAQADELYEYAIPGEELRHNIVVLRKTAPTPKQYPRRFAQIKKSPPITCSTNYMQAIFFLFHIYNIVYNFVYFAHIKIVFFNIFIF